MRKRGFHPASSVSDLGDSNEPGVKYYNSYEVSGIVGVTRKERNGD
jgi:hypothetical protein